MEGETMPPNQGVAMGWTRRDPEAEAEAEGYCSQVRWWARMDGPGGAGFRSGDEGRRRGLRRPLGGSVSLSGTLMKILQEPTLAF